MLAPDPQRGVGGVDPRKHLPALRRWGLFAQIAVGALVALLAAAVSSLIFNTATTSGSAFAASLELLGSAVLASAPRVSASGWFALVGMNLLFMFAAPSR